MLKMNHPIDAGFKIPIEVVFEILTRLPVIVLLRCMCVCKSWYSMIKDNRFIHKQLDLRRTTADIKGYVIYNPPHAIDCDNHLFSVCNGKFAECKALHLPFECPSRGLLKIVGSCNGLLCLTDSSPKHFGRVIYFWNPSIEKFKKIDHYCLSLSRIVFLGFGFDIKNLDYKVVRIFYLEDHTLPDAEIYNLSTNSWRRIKAVVPCVCLVDNISAIFVNGASHWTAIKKLYDGCKFILSFDHVDEIFREITLPNYNEETYPGVCVAEIRGLLSVALCGMDFEFGCIWVMKEYGAVESWAKIYTFGPEHNIGRPILFGWDGELLNHVSHNLLNAYYLDVGQIETVFEKTEPGVIGDVTTYAESLVLI